MASTPMMPPNAYGGAPAAPPLPGTDMTSICFRDQLWLNTYPLDRNLIFDYFALSPFYDWTCNNEQLRARAIHSLDFSHISKMTGIEYTLSEVMEPNIFVIRKQKRDSPEEGHTNADLLHLGWFNIPSSTALQRVCSSTCVSSKRSLPSVQEFPCP